MAIKAPDAPAPEAPITDLPIRSEAENSPINVSGSLKEMLDMAKMDAEDAPLKAEAPTPAPEPDEPDSAVKRANDKLHEKIFGKKRAAKAKEPTAKPEPAPEPEEGAHGSSATEGSPPPAPVPAPAPAKRVPVKDPATELANRYADLERQRLDLERQKLELEKERNKPAAPALTPEPPAMKLMSPEERYEYEIFGQMGKSDTTKYGEHQKKFLESVEAAAKYKADWEKKNPNDEFDPQDSDHDAFYNRNSVRYDKLDFKRAEVKLAAGDEKPAQDENTKRELEQLKLQNVMRDIQPRAMNAFGRSVEGMLNEIDPDIAKVVKEGGRKGLLEHYPDYADDILAAFTSINRFSDEAFKVLETNGLVQPDKTNGAHSTILDIIVAQEPLITSQDKEDQKDPSGRPFATWDQWVQMSPQQQANHWHLGADEVVEIFTQSETQKLKKDMEHFDKRVEARAKRNGHAPRALEPAPAKTPAPSPSISSRSVIDTAGGATPETGDKFTKTVRSILFKR